MSAMETLLRTVLNVSGVDVEEIKKEVTTRIAAFEANVETLNNTLIKHHQMLERIENKIDALLNPTTTAKPEISNADNGNTVSAIVGPNAQV